MKRLYNTALAFAARCIVIVFAAALLSLQAGASGVQSDVSDALSGVDLSAADEFLDDNGVDMSDPESISNVGAGAILGYLFDVLKSAISSPLKILLTVVVIAFVCEVTKSASTSAGIGGQVFVIICFLAVSPQIINTFSDMLLATSSMQAFTASYIPIFAAITAASGNMGAATSYSALVLYAAESVTAISTAILKPVLACMLVLACAQAISGELPDLTGTLRRVFTGITGAVMTVFVGVIGLQTVVGRTSTNIALRTGKYLVSSFVPVIGMSLSESYKTVMVSISAMRSAVGALGIIVIIIILSVPIITMWVHKLIFNICEWLCAITNSTALASLMRGIADVYSLCVTLLLIYSMMFIIATGMLIVLGGEAYI